MAACRLCLPLVALLLGSALNFSAVASTADTSSAPSGAWPSGNSAWAAPAPALAGWPADKASASAGWTAKAPAPAGWPADKASAPINWTSEKTSSPASWSAKAASTASWSAKAAAPVGGPAAAAQPFAGNASPLIANPASVWSAAPGAAPWASKPSAPKPAVNPQTSKAAGSEAAAPDLGVWQKAAQTPQQVQGWEQPSAAAPGAVNTEAFSPSKRAAAAAGLVPPIGSQTAASEVAPKAPSPSPGAWKASQETATPNWAAAPGNATAWEPAPSKGPAGPAKAPAGPAKAPAPARKQPGAYIKAPGGRAENPTDYVPESIRDIKWNSDGSAGNATARVYPTQSDPQRSRPQLSDSEAAYATYSGTGVVDSRAHTLDPTRVASTGAALQSSGQGAKKPTTAGGHALDAPRTVTNDVSTPFQTLGSQQYIPKGMEDVASRVNGQIVIPSGADVRPEDISAAPASGDPGSAAAAPAPAPAANYTLPSEIPPNVNASWLLVDSPTGATCEVLMRPYILQQDGHTNPNLWGAIEADRPPTSSPPLDFLRGSVDLRIFNNATTDLAVPYTLTVVSPPSVKYESASNLVVASSGPNGIGNLTAVLPDLAIPSGTNLKANVSFTVNATGQDFYPRRVLLNGQPCMLRIGLDLNAPIPTVLPNGTLIEDNEQPVSVTLGQFTGSKGEPLQIKGINWFGFETSSTSVDGLWQGPSAITQNFDTIAWRIKLLGFNTIRLPFSFQVLFNLAPRSYTTACTPTTADDVKQSVIPPGVTTPAGVDPPQLVVPGDPLGSSGVCNADLPNTSGYARFLWVLRYLTANGFYVLIDNHLSFDNTAVSNTPQWLAWWAQLMTDVAQLPSTRNRVMVDIMNEPDVLGLRWQGTTPDMSSLYLAAMETIYPISPTTLFFIEGGGQLPYSMCWGDGFVTDPTIIAANGLSNPNPFFTTLLTKPYLNNVVISPHYYPPSISQAKTGVSGTALWERMQNSFGYLTSGQGYQGHVFPLVIGETGSMYLTQADVLFLSDMAKYMKNDAAASVYPHATLNHLIWWAWNPNSGDTGGIVQDDWLTVIWNKVDYLINAIGLQPWYAAVLSGGATTPADTAAAPAAPAATGPPVAPVATVPPATDAPVVTVPPLPEATPAPAGTTPPVQPQLQPQEQPAPVVTAAPDTTAPLPPPETTPPPPTTPAQTTPPPTTPAQTTPPQTTPSTGGASGSSGCLVRASVGSVWSAGSGVWKASLDVHLQATGGSTLPVPYTLQLSNPAYTSLEKSWTWDGSYTGSGTASGQVTQQWAELLKQQGNTVDVGGIVVGSSNSLLPTQASINGVICELKM